MHLFDRRLSIAVRSICNTIKVKQLEAEKQTSNSNNKEEIQEFKLKVERLTQEVVFLLCMCCEESFNDYSICVYITVHQTIQGGTASS